jgi:hypothetical protein
MGVVVMMLMNSAKKLEKERERKGRRGEDFGRRMKKIGSVNNHSFRSSPVATILARWCKRGGLCLSLSSDDSMDGWFGFHGGPTTAKSECDDEGVG